MNFHVHFSGASHSPKILALERGFTEMTKQKIIFNVHSTGCWKKLCFIKVSQKV